MKVSRAWDLRYAKVAFAIVYTLAMSKIIRVQVHGVETALSISADEVKEEMTPSGTEPIRLKLTLAGKPVGEFKTAIVDGWWIEE
jgi:hypothetical protein